MKTKFLTAILMCVISIGYTFAQTLPTFKVAGLPSAQYYAGYSVEVTDGASATDCSVGGGTTLVKCTSTSGVWVGAAIGGSGITLTTTGTSGPSTYIGGILNVPNYATSSSPLTTKGDLYGFSTVGARVPVGTDGTVLTADSTAAAGVSYKTPSSGGLPSGTGIVAVNGGTGALATGAQVASAISGQAITPTSTNGVSAATMAFNDATSSIQTQLNGKQSTGTYVNTVNGSSGAVVLNSANLIGSYLFANLPTCSSSVNTNAQAQVTDVGDTSSFWACLYSTHEAVYEWALVNGHVELAASGIFSGIPPSGSFANNGAYTTSNAIAFPSGVSYPVGAYLYFPAGAIASGSVAASYWSSCASATSCTVYNNKLNYTVATLPAASGVSGKVFVVSDGATGSDCTTGSGSDYVLCQSNGTTYAVTTVNHLPSVPGSPTAFVTTGSGAFTQTTGTYFPLGTYMVGANVMGPRGKLELNANWSMTSSTNAKTFGQGFGYNTTAPVVGIANSTSGNAGYQTFIVIKNQENADIQNYFGWYGYGGAGSIANTTYFTTVPQAVVQFGKLATATESLMVANWDIQLVRP